MKVNVYTIYDVVAKECGPIFQAKNHDVAVRAFKSLISENLDVHINVHDYDLYCLGEFDNEKCSFVPLDVAFKVPVVFSDVSDESDLFSEVSNK